MEQQQLNGNDIPDFGNATPGTPTGPFIMQPEGMGRLFAINKMAEGPFPEHYEPIETPLGTNPLHPNVVSNPVVRLYEQDALRMGRKRAVPYVGQTLPSDRALPHLDQARIAQRNCSPDICGNQPKRWRRRKALIMAIVSLSPASVDLSARWLW